MQSTYDAQTEGQKTSLNSTVGWLSAEDFANACAALPLVSVDLYVTKRVANHLCLLLGLRNNRPAKDCWFTPGGRVRKGETVPQALVRVALEELGCTLDHTHSLHFLGVWDHTYPDSAYNPDVATHYVNLAYTLDLPNLNGDFLPCTPAPGAQHSQWCWQPLDKMDAALQVHCYVKQTASMLLDSSVTPKKA